MKIPLVRAPACFRSFFQCPLRRNGREMELTRTCCFEFDGKRGPGSKQLFLHTFCFYFMVAGFTYLSSLPEVHEIVH